MASRFIDRFAKVTFEEEVKKAGLVCLLAARTYIVWKPGLETGLLVKHPLVGCCGYDRGSVYADWWHGSYHFPVFQQIYNIGLKAVAVADTPYCYTDHFEKSLFGLVPVIPLDSSEIYRAFMSINADRRRRSYEGT